MPAKPRILLGPGPSEMHPRVAAALAVPLIGHMDPVFLKIMDETQEMLRRLFGTSNRLTLPMSATGSGGMETCLVNLIEPGDRVVVGVHGVFGGRIADGARRLGASVLTVEAPWGTALDPERVSVAIREHRPMLTAVVHAETSTGVLLPEATMREIGAAVCETGGIFLVDCVTSLGGTPVEPERWPADACFSGSQKCLSCPPGLSPVTFNERALEKTRARRTPVSSWYFDLGMLEKYWGGDRVYHHTAPVSMVFALREALEMAFEEGFPARFLRHARNRDALVAGLAALGLALLVKDNHRLPMLTSIHIPQGVEDRSVRGRLLDEDGIEIGGGLGPLAGRIWRIGLMGYSSRPENILALLDAMGGHLGAAGHACDPREARRSAEAVLAM